MAEYINKEQFLSSMGLVGDETKYGNRDSEHQNRSYGTWMGYEIMDSIDDCVEEDAVRVVRCKDCIHWKKGDSKGGNSIEDLQWIGGCKWAKCCRREMDFCSYGERKDNG